MKKYLIVIVALLMLLTGCASDSSNFNANLAAFNKENINIDQSDINIGSITISKSNDCYIIIVNIFLENDEIFESVLINNTLTSVYEDYKVVLGLGTGHPDVFNDASIWKSLTIQKYIVNHTITYVINEIDIPSNKIIEFDRVINSEQSFSSIELSFYGINNELFYFLETYVELAE